MSDEFESYPTLPDFNQLLAQRLASKSTEGTPTAASQKFDPHKLMVKKKEEAEKPVDTSNVVKWPEEDIKSLEDFCRKHGIAGFSAGKMSPIAALAYLKSQLGIVDAPLEERVPQGYQKIGTKSSYNCNYPYSKAIEKKTLLNG